MKIKECFEYIHKLISDNSDILSIDEQIVKNISNDFINNSFCEKMLNKIKIIFNSLLYHKNELLEFFKKYDACNELNIRGMCMIPNHCCKFEIYHIICEKILIGFWKEYFIIAIHS